MPQRMQACTPCHGKEGRATPDGYFPRIAGKPAGYLHAQLLHFQQGRRQHALMTHMVRHLSDDYMAEIAAYFAALDLPYAAQSSGAASHQTLARGRTLVEQGDPARQLPACSACHGAALMGVGQHIPGLLGLPRDYLLAQLGAWRTGQRRMHAPDCMAQVAKRLSDDEATAVASFLAAQAVPSGALVGHGARVETPVLQPLPLRCGSAAP